MSQWAFKLIIDAAIVVLRLFHESVCDIAVVVFNMIEM